MSGVRCGLDSLASQVAECRVCDSAVQVAPVCIHSLCDSLAPQGVVPQCTTPWGQSGWHPSEVVPQCKWCGACLLYVEPEEYFIQHLCLIIKLMLPFLGFCKTDCAARVSYTQLYPDWIQS